MIEIYYKYPWGYRPVHYKSWKLVETNYIDENGKHTDAGISKVFYTATDNHEYDVMRKLFEDMHNDFSKRERLICKEYNTNCFEVKGKDKEMLYYLEGEMDYDRFTNNG